MMLTDDLRAVARQCLQFFLDSTSDWSVKQGDFTKNPSRIEGSVYQGEYFNNTSSSTIWCVRGRLRFPNIKPQQILDLLVKLDERPKWDSQMKSGEISTVLEEDKWDIAHLSYNGMWPFVSARDLCLLRAYGEVESLDLNLSSTNFRPGTLVLLAKSVEHDSVPTSESSSFTRAELKECVYVMEPAGDSSTDSTYYTDVTYISSLDFKGSFPPWFTNIILSQQPRTLVAMRDVLSSSSSSEDYSMGSFCTVQ